MSRIPEEEHIIDDRLPKKVSLRQLEEFQITAVDASEEDDASLIEELAQARVLIDAEEDMS
jgi:hypothetical protein